MALALGAGAAAANINSAYQLRGDFEAGVVQAFDDGRQLYIQIRDPANPPAPVGPQGPLVYRIQGHYLVVPLVPSVTLRLGAHQANVIAVGARDAAPGVVSITRPIEAVDTPSAAPVAVLPVVPVTPGVVAPLAAAETVRGEIEVAGSSGVVARAASSAGTTAPASQRAVSFDQAVQSTAFAGVRGMRITLKSDGSVAGARAAQKALSTCRKAGATCSIEYRGADAGTIQITEKQ